MTEKQLQIIMEQLYNFCFNMEIFLASILLILIWILVILIKR